jgi:FemAB-related protein (PEP-CTERM system-associated)
MGVNATFPLAANAMSPTLLRTDICAPTASGEWNDFLAKQSSGSFYHLYEWSQINRSQLGHESFFLTARDSDALQGVLPLTMVSSPLFGRILCSMPFVNYGGPCTANAAAATSLIAAARTLAHERKAKYLELRCAAPCETDMQLSTRKISMSIALDADANVLFERFASKHRTNIRRSFKNGLEVRSGGAELLPTFYRVMEESWRSLGTPFYSRSYFAAIMQTFGERTRIFVCSRGDEPVAVAFNGYFNGVVEGMWAGGTAAARGLQANYALYWDMIKDACERGFTNYHLGRSTADSGAEDFKKKWNAHSQQLYWYFDRPDGGAMPELNVQNPKYKLAIAAWRRLPLPIIRVIGPPIARSIP